MKSEILGLFVNILTADHNYCLCNKENLQEFKKQNVLSQFVAVFLKSTSNFDHFETNEDTHNLSLSEITDCERRG